MTISKIHCIIINLCQTYRHYPKKEIQLLICFSKKTVQEFGTDLSLVDYDYSYIESKLINDKKFIERIDRYYTQDPLSDFYKKNIRNLPYLPVGIKIFKKI